MKTWDKGYKLDEQVEKFTVGSDRVTDLVLAPYDILGSLAHASMLGSIGILSKKETLQLTGELKNLYKIIQSGDFQIEPDVEDIHSQVEKHLIEKLGDLGKKIHTGRSRNDQVLVDLHLFIRDKLALVVKVTAELAKVLIGMSNRHKEMLLPGYTHYQVAMPASFGLWFASFAESLADDLLVCQAAYRMSDQNPLGSGAGFGSSFPLDRKLTTRLLGFRDMRYNVMHAMKSRGKLEQIAAQALASVGDTLSKLASDVCLYAGQDYGFIELPGEYTTGSSIMPHKKNPDLFEMIRGYCNRLRALPNEIAMISSNLHTGYHREFQLMKEPLFEGFEVLLNCLRILIKVIPELGIRSADLNQEKYRYLFSVEEVNRHVLNGLPFREAYRKIAKDIESGDYSPGQDLQHTHEGSIGNLCNDEVLNKIDERLREFNFQTGNKALQKLLEG
ncbi:MAG: argininosuccinate lyase [Bacteroidales bacterium]|nr:argininosuccinate lyase [Bacteroidales bacterium]